MLFFKTLRHFVKDFRQYWVRMQEDQIIAKAESIQISRGHVPFLIRAHELSASRLTPWAFTEALSECVDAIDDAREARTD